MKKCKIEVIKLTASTKEEATIKMLTTPVGDGIRMSNQEIVDELIEAFGDASINSVRWYSSKLAREMEYRVKYDIDESRVALTPRRVIKS